MFRKFLIPLLVGLVMLVSTTVTAGPEGSVRGGNRDRVAVIDAKDFDLNKLEGSVVLMAFWQSLCEPCEAYVKWLTEMQERYLEEGLVIVAVNQDRDSAAAVDMVKLIHPRTQVVLDSTGRIATQYELDDMPSSYLIDRNLELQDLFLGFDPTKTEPIEAVIIQMLEQKHKD